MQTTTILNIASASFALVGSIVLAFSLDRPLLTLRTHVKALDTTVEGLIDPSANIVRFVGFDAHHVRSFDRGTLLVRVGCGLLVIAFALQLVSALMSG